MHYMPGEIKKDGGQWSWMIRAVSAPLVWGKLLMLCVCMSMSLFGVWDDRQTERQEVRERKL